MNIIITYYQRIFLAITLVMSVFSSSAQVNVQDSLALVDFYNSTNGDEWNDNSNWLNGPVDTWIGVVLDQPNSGDRVIGIALPENNLSGSIPNSILMLDMLFFLEIPFNNITTLPDLSSLNATLNVLDVAGNRLRINDIAQNQFPQNYNYSPQFVGMEQDTLVCEGESILIPSLLEATQGQPTWFYNNNPITNTSNVTSNGGLYFEFFEKENQGFYHCEIADNSIFPPLDIIRLPLEIISCCRDSLGAPFYCNQLIVKFQDGVTPFTKEVVRNQYKASLLDSVLCLDIELWSVPDSVFLQGDTLSTIEEIKDRTRTQTEIEEVDFNHFTEFEEKKKAFKKRKRANSSLKRRIKKVKEGHKTTSDSLLVAIIDTGVDYDHLELTDLMHYNDLEVFDGTDTDGNCIVDDVIGFNYVDPMSSDPMDDHSHGTHIAGIIADSLPVGTSTRILPLKTHDYHGRSSTFNLISSIYYACHKGARVLNISSGYAGIESTILKGAIAMVGDSCDAVVVTSSGNKGVDNDMLAHYPSSFDLPNIVSVAALDSDLDELAFYSNLGLISVDLAAPGTFISSTLPDNAYGVKSGTSMSAGFVSSAAAILLEEYPEIRSDELITCLFSSVDPLVDLAGKMSTGGKLNIPATRTCLENLEPALRIRFFLEGSYIDGLMKDDLKTEGVLSTVEPYTALGHSLSNTGAAIAPDLLAAGGDSSIVDWVLVQLHDKTDRSIVLASQAVVVLADGRCIGLDGREVLSFPSLSYDDYYVSIIHRNHLPLMTQDPILVDRSYSLIDFTNGSVSLYKDSAQKSFGDGNWGAVAGDADGNSSVSASDRAATWNDRNQTGYKRSDVNLDGSVSAADRAITWNNRNREGALP